MFRFLVQPDRGVSNEYVQEMTDVLAMIKQLWLTGRLVEFWNVKALSEQIMFIIQSKN
jgi:hypothetical protein